MWQQMHLRQWCRRAVGAGVLGGHDQCLRCCRHHLHIGYSLGSTWLHQIQDKLASSIHLKRHVKAVIEDGQWIISEVDGRLQCLQGRPWHQQRSATLNHRCFDATSPSSNVHWQLDCVLRSLGLTIAKPEMVDLLSHAWCRNALRLPEACKSPQGLLADDCHNPNRVHHTRGLTLTALHLALISHLQNPLSHIDDAHAPIDGLDHKESPHFATKCTSWPSTLEASTKAAPEVEVDFASLPSFLDWDQGALRSRDQCPGFPHLWHLVLFLSSSISALKALRLSEALSNFRARCSLAMLLTFFSEAHSKNLCNVLLREDLPLAARSMISKKCIDVIESPSSSGRSIDITSSDSSTRAAPTTFFWNRVISEKHNRIDRLMSSRLRLPWACARMTAFCSSVRPARWRISHPRASSGNVTLVLRDRRSKSSVVRATHVFTVSPSMTFNWKTSASNSPSSSDLSLLGNLDESGIKDFPDDFLTILALVLWHVQMLDAL